MRLIDADELYRTVKTECNKYGKPTICFECGNKVLDLIDNAPTVNIEGVFDCGYYFGHKNIIEEIPHGKWRDGYGGEYLCTNCLSHSERITPFCKHCGADMRGEQDDK